jgi:hypothetical protein
MDYASSITTDRKEKGFASVGRAHKTWPLSLIPVDVLVSYAYHGYMKHQIDGKERMIYYDAYWPTHD